MPTKNNRSPITTQVNCTKYCGVLMSALIHFAKSNNREAVTPDATHTIPYRLALKVCGFSRHAAYAITMAIAGPTTNKVSSCTASVTHKYFGFIDEIVTVENRDSLADVDFVRKQDLTPTTTNRG